MSTKTLLLIATELRKSIGKHVPLIGKQVPAEIYENARKESDEAVSLAKYLIMHLDSRHDAVTFANMVGMPGYINMR